MKYKVTASVVCRDWDTADEIANEFAKLCDRLDKCKDYEIVLDLEEDEAKIYLDTLSKEVHNVGD